MPDIASRPKLAPTDWNVKSLSVDVSSVINTPIMLAPKTLNARRPTSMEKNTRGFRNLLNWIPKSIASINPIAESWLPYNAASRGAERPTDWPC